MNDHTRTCKSGPQLGGVIQQDLSTLITNVLGCYCMTEEDGEVSVSSCIYLYYSQGIVASTNMPHHSTTESHMCKLELTRPFMWPMC